MPLLLAILALDAIFLAHAGATGRFRSWGSLILALPILGALLYALVEIIPDWLDDELVRDACFEAGPSVDRGNCE